MKRIFQLLLISCLFVACSSDNDSLVESKRMLNLSCDGSVRIDEMDFEFDILEGNGGYVVTLSNEEDATVTIDEENRVKINLLTNRVQVTVTDQKQQSKTVGIYSTLKSLVPSNYVTSLPNESSSITSVEFGVGGYRVENIRGNSAEVDILENDQIKITTLKPGNSYYKIIDERGTTARFDVEVIGRYEMTSGQLRIIAENDQINYVSLKCGEAPWKLVGGATSILLEKVYLQPNEGLLQIYTSKETVRGNDFIKLKDAVGNEVVVEVVIK